MTGGRGGWAGPLETSRAASKGRLQAGGQIGPENSIAEAETKLSSGLRAGGELEQDDEVAGMLQP